MTPDLPGILGGDEVAATAAFIAGLQQADGGLPWPDGHVDAWDHVESAMALTVGGLLGPARKAFRWCAEHQRADGSWPSRTVNGVVEAPSADTNQCAYIAVGVWHHWRITGDDRFLAEMWPVVRSAVRFVLDQQLPSGAIAWEVDAAGVRAGYALLTGNASMYQALRCATHLADVLGSPEPDWELAAADLEHALVRHPEAFADKSRFSMDWYYPVLAGVLRGPAGLARLNEQWGRYMIAGWGCRCVEDNLWVTGAETCELVLALDAVGDTARARAVFAEIQHLRRDDGGYWTGYVIPEAKHWPAEGSSWTAAAVVLAADALARHTPANGLFRGEGLPARPAWAGPSCDCETVAP